MPTTFARPVKITCPWDNHTLSGGHEIVEFDPEERFAWRVAVIRRAPPETISTDSFVGTIDEAKASLRRRAGARRTASVVAANGDVEQNPVVWEDDPTHFAYLNGLDENGELFIECTVQIEGRIQPGDRVYIQEIGLSETHGDRIYINMSAREAV